MIPAKHTVIFPYTYEIKGQLNYSHPPPPLKKNPQKIKTNKQLMSNFISYSNLNLVPML